MISRLVFLLAAAAVVFWLSGCATVPDDRNSDMPWSTPQTWEGTIPMPGMDVNR